MSARIMGPPDRGPVVRIIGKGIDVWIRVESDEDHEIMRLALEVAERRRYGKFETC